MAQYGFEQLFTNKSVPVLKFSVTNAVQNIYISDEVFYILQFYIVSVLGSFLCTFGAASNIINAIVYYKQGINDSVTVTYIALSVWDAGLCVMTLITVILITIDSLFSGLEIDLMSVQYVYVAAVRSVTHMLSTIVTVYLSVELCICIMIPLKVKFIFTKSRSILIHFAICVFTIACYCPVWATQSLQLQFDPRFNRSRYLLSFSKDRPGPNIFLAIFNGNVVPVTALVISVVCTILLISGIKKSAKFRQNISNADTKQKENLTSLSFSNTANISTVRISKLPTKSSKAMSNKYTKLAKVTVLISITFLICNIPVAIVAMARIIVTGLSSNIKLYGLLYTVVYTSTLANSGVSIFVYYYGSRKFKAIFLFLFFGTGKRKKL